MGARISQTQSPDSSTDSTTGGEPSQGFNLLRVLPGFQLPQDGNTITDRQRARSLSSVMNHSPASSGASAYNTSSQSHIYTEQSQRYPSDIEYQIPSGSNDLGRVYAATSLPSHIWTFNGIKCPVCNQLVLPGDIECHLVICLTKPRLSYNEDVLSDAKGECIICLEELDPGDIIARLPCLCIYHKGCIDRWFEVNRSCPEHPGNF